MSEKSNGLYPNLLTKEYLLSQVDEIEELHIEEHGEKALLLWDDEDAKFLPVNFLEHMEIADLTDKIEISEDIPERYSIDKKALAEYLYEVCDKNAFITLDRLAVIWSEPDGPETFEPSDFTDSVSRRMAEEFGDEYAHKIGMDNLGQLWFERNIAVVNMGEIVRIAEKIAEENSDLHDPWFGPENQIQIGFLTTVLHELRHLQMETNIFLSEEDYPLHLALESEVENYCTEVFEQNRIPDIFTELYGGKDMSELSKLLDRAFENKGNKNYYHSGSYAVAFEERPYETIFEVYYDRVPVLHGTTWNKEVRLCTSEDIHTYDKLFKAVAEALPEYHFDGEVYLNYMEKQQEDKLLNAVMNAEGAAIRDDYAQLIIQDKNGDYSFIREANGNPVTPLMEDEMVVGRVFVFWYEGRLKTAYEPIPAEQPEDNLSEDLARKSCTYTNEELFCNLADELHDVLVAGEYGTWEDICTGMQINDIMRFGYDGIVVWGEENDVGEQFYSISIRKGYSADGVGEEVTKVFSESKDFEDFEEAFYLAIRAAESLQKPSLSSQISSAEGKSAEAVSPIKFPPKEPER